MAFKTAEKVEGLNYVAAQLGDWDGLSDYGFTFPTGKPVKGKFFLKDLLKLSSMEISVNKLGPGHGVPFYHTHQQHEEVYIFLKGTGQFQVDGKVIDVREGTIISVAPNGKRTWRNNSSDDLYYVVIQAECGSLTGDTTKDGMMVSDPVTWP